MNALTRIDTAMDNLRAAVNMAVASAKMPNAQDTPTLSELVATQRTRLGLTLQEVAADAHCTKSHVWEIESGRSKNPTIATVWGLSIALRVPFQTIAASALLTAMENRR